MLKLLLKKLNQILDLMLEEKEFRKQERDRLEQERRDIELMSYAKERRNQSPSSFTTSLHDTERLVNTKEKIAIPYGLSHDDKMLIEDFYNEK